MCDPQKSWCMYVWETLHKITLSNIKEDSKQWTELVAASTAENSCWMMNT